MTGIVFRNILKKMMPRIYFGGNQQESGYTHENDEILGHSGYIQFFMKNLAMSSIHQKTQSPEPCFTTRLKNSFQEMPRLDDMHTKKYSNEKTSES